MLFGLAFWACASSARQIHQAAKRLPYAPPVIADTLPAEEVLVRGSEEPLQEQSNVLLRCADGDRGARERELLISIKGQGKE